MGKPGAPFIINVPDYYGTETVQETILWLKDLHFQIKGEVFNFVGKKRQPYITHKTLIAALFLYARR